MVEADIILSIVPPRDAIATARRVLEGCKTASKQRAERRGTAAVAEAPSVLYLDLNAISPKTTKLIASFLSSEQMPATPSLRRSLTRTLSFIAEPEVEPVPIQFTDGGIIGGPPSLQEDQTWKCPSMVISGPKADVLPEELRKILNMKIVSDKIGSASALKSCFASLTKGLTALSIMSYTTAHTCGVLPELQEHLEKYSPRTHALANSSLTSMPPKAYRWVDEMKQIGETFSEEGGFTAGLGGDVFQGISDIYKLVADGTVLGKEKSEKRKRGTKPEDVAECVAEGIQKKRRKDAGEEKLDLTWRGSWS